MQSSQQRKVLIVEDEVFIAEMLKAMLEDMGHIVVASAYDVATAMEAIVHSGFDFGIFDINLEGGMEGLELARYAQEKRLPFMFLTSYTDQKTLEEAKVTKPGAYVLKPFTDQDLYTGIEMALMHAGAEHNDVIPIKVGHRTILLNPEEILYLKADNIYVEVCTKDKRHLVRQSLTGFMDMYPREDLIRIHRSYAVNKRHVDTWTRSAVEVNGLEIPVSRSYREVVKNRLS